MIATIVQTLCVGVIGLQFLTFISGFLWAAFGSMTARKKVSGDNEQ